jgi:hypothetical protein
MERKAFQVTLRDEDGWRLALAYFVTLRSVAY